MSPDDAKLDKPNLTVVTSIADEEYKKEKSKRKSKNRKSLSPNTTPTTVCSTPSTTRSELSISSTMSSGQRSAKLRNKSDLRSPGIKATPTNGSISKKKQSNGHVVAAQGGSDNAPIPDFITQTDQYGNATTPRNGKGIQKARNGKHTRNGQNGVVNMGGKDGNDENNNGEKTSTDDADQCETLLESIRMMCCCIMVEDQQRHMVHQKGISSPEDKTSNKNGRSNYSLRPNGSPMLLPTDPSDQNKIRLLPTPHPDDEGKKCLVLDLDETLVHSSFRAVPGADFVIPVQIEDVVHFVYVAKRPGADEFLLEMAKHYEIIVYTASLNKYADPLLDLLDPHRVIRTRLFRESCVYYEGNYVKDLSLLDRDLTQTIIVDNSPSSYIFHPENAIDCSSFIDDPMDRELDQIGSFLVGVKEVSDVRSVCSWWRSWPDIDIEDNGLSFDSYGR
mmetsp:Transcript_6932/g.8627  ORF Transcript_6932/g.8627 Transcript_6932/m.8627 type:complete len:447 (-) Transcript_6932:302-1642(-)